MKQNKTDDTTNPVPCIDTDVDAFIAYFQDLEINPATTLAMDIAFLAQETMRKEDVSVYDLIKKLQTSPSWISSFLRGDLANLKLSQLTKVFDTLGYKVNISVDKKEV